MLMSPQTSLYLNYQITAWQIRFSKTQSKIKSSLCLLNLTSKKYFYTFHDLVRVPACKHVTFRQIFFSDLATIFINSLKLITIFGTAPVVFVWELSYWGFESLCRPLYIDIASVSGLSFVTFRQFQCVDSL